MQWVGSLSRSSRKTCSAATLAAAVGIIVAAPIGSSSWATVKGRMAQPQKARVKSVFPSILVERPNVVTGQSVTFKASLHYNHQPLKNRTLRFDVRYANTAQVAWQSAGTAQTDDKGTATITVAVPANALPERYKSGSGGVQVSFGGDVNADNVFLYRASKHYTAFTIVRPGNSGNSVSGDGGGGSPPATPDTVPPTQTPPDTPPSEPAVSPSGSGGSSGGNSGGGITDKTAAAGEETPIGPASLPLMRELQKRLGTAAASDMAKDNNLSDRVAPNAIALVADPGEAKPRRFWLEMRVDDITSEAKKDLFSTKTKSHAHLTATLHDTVLNTSVTQPFERDAQDTQYLSGINDFIQQNAGKIKTDAGVRDQVAQKLMVSLPNVGKALREAVGEAARWAQNSVKTAEWAGRVENVENDEYYLAGAVTTIGEKLQAVRIITVGSKVVRRNKGVLEVKEITSDGVVIAKRVSGTVEKNDVVCKSTQGTASGTPASPTSTVHLIGNKPAAKP